MARTLARTQGQADLPTPKASRAGRRPLRDISANPPVHDIPYFADMQLDPARYPIGKLTLPLCPEIE